MTTSKRKGQSAFIRGAAGRSQTDAELVIQKQRAAERKAANSMPFRFYTPIGETRRVIICDDAPDFFMYEHALKNAEGKWGRLFTGCVKTFDNCPVCEATARESYYAMFLTVIDLTPFETRDGLEVEFSRKLLVVKPAQQKKFLRFYAKEGSLRGAMFDMTRDGDKDPSIGNDIEFVEFIEEDEMLTFNRTWKDKEGKKQNENSHEVYEYEKLFEEPTTEALRATVGGQPPAGSREADSRAIGGRSTSRSRDKDDWEDDKDSGNYGGKSKAKPTRGRARDEEEDEEDEEEEVAPRRGRAAAAKPKPTRGRAPVEEDEEDLEDEEEAPRRGRAKAATPTRGRGRSAPVDEEEEELEEDELEEEEEEAPRRGRATAKAKPAAKPTRGRAKPAPEEEDEEEEDDDDLPFTPTKRAPAPARAPARRGRAAPAAEEEEEEAPRLRGRGARR